MNLFSRLTLYLQTCLHLFNICHCYMRLLLHVEGLGEEMEIVLMSWICCVFFIIIVCQRVLISFYIKVLLLVVRGKNKDFRNDNNRKYVCCQASGKILHNFLIQ